MVSRVIIYKKRPIGFKHIMLTNMFRLFGFIVMLTSKMIYSIFHDLYRTIVYGLITALISLFPTENVVCTNYKKINDCLNYILKIGYL